MPTIKHLCVFLLACALFGGCAAQPLTELPGPLASGGKADGVGSAVHGLVDSFVILDAEVEGVSFSWVQTGGPTVELENPELARARFTPERIGDYSFELEFEDGDGATNIIGQVAHVHQVSAGKHQTFLLRSDARLFGWGSNERGQLGIGTVGGHVDAPIEICEERGECDQAPFDRLAEIAIGYSHTLVRTEDGFVWGWGHNSQGQVGSGESTLINGTVQPEPDPIQVCGPEGCDEPLSGVVRIAATWYASVATLSDGTLWGWGSTGHGQLALGAHQYSKISYPIQLCWDATSRPDDLECVVTLEGVRLFPVHNAQHLLANDRSTLISWGQNRKGQTGHNVEGSDGSHTGPSYRNSDIPSTTPLFPREVCADQSRLPDPTGERWCTDNGFTDVVMAKAVEGNSYAIRRDGTLWAWGDNEFGQLGAPDNPGCYVYNWECSDVPVQVCVDEGCTEMFSGVTSVAGGPNFAVAVTEDGQTWSWGAAPNSFGVADDSTPLGRAGQQGTERPALVCGVADDACETTLDGVSAVTSGVSHTIAVTRDGRLITWGQNNSGQLGLGSTEEATVPQLVTTL